VEAKEGALAESKDTPREGTDQAAHVSPDRGTLDVARAELLVDPIVSRAKFARDVEQCRRLGAELRRRGWWILEAEFPNVVAAFVAPQLRPRPVLFGALINFENYDLWAPSVRIVDPFTGKLLLSREIPPHLAFTRRVQAPSQVQIPGLGLVPGYAEQPLLISHGPNELPFFCLPGVREYHEHPAHTGDDWLLHRDRGEGTLYFLLEKLAHYGLEPVQQYQFGLQIVGYARGEAPE
jgi:hypothetical protein